MARLLFFFLLIVPADLCAAETEPLSLFRSGIKLAVAMAIVIGIMLLFHALSRKGFRLLEKRQGGRIRVMESRPMGGRKALCLVEVDGQRLLLGLGNDRMELLHHFDAAANTTGQFEKHLRSHDEVQS
ncbi:flagellar protein FliO/FliZ [Desulfosalsimonas propionicica]|uniref:Flagellar protein FliO/FliZ n=1 Tax=Desulfosalsimonas propionicica TaxID=332175 RepID=A0A7W0C8W8_9BACT|nr:flagellar biosynthetic protein FliO [Desulfosalsimonas propionicica]MBA2881311.1 flagellar protein FliO/FliZ [Desulfosalsimonas propionicica]